MAHRSVILIIVVAIAACSKPPAPVSEPELIGRWIADDGAKQVELALHSDHTFVSQQKPHSDMSVSAVLGQNLMFSLLPDSGTWQLTGPAELEIRGAKGVVMSFHDLQVDTKALDCRIGEKAQAHFKKAESL